MKLSNIVLLLLSVVGAVGCSNSGPSTEQRLGAARAANSKLTEIVQISEKDGLLAAAAACEETGETETAYGVVWVRCGVGAEFYDPDTPEETIAGNVTTLRVGIYTRVGEVSRSFLEQGYVTRNASVSVFAYTFNPNNSTFPYPDVRLERKL